MIPSSTNRNVTINRGITITVTIILLSVKLGTKVGWLSDLDIKRTRNKSLDTLSKTRDGQFYIHERLPLNSTINGTTNACTKSPHIIDYEVFIFIWTNADQFYW